MSWVNVVNDHDFKKTEIMFWVNVMSQFAWVNLLGSVCLGQFAWDSLLALVYLH